MFFREFKMSLNVTYLVWETVEFQDKMIKVWWIMLPSDAEYDSCLQQGCIYSGKATLTAWSLYRAGGNVFASNFTCILSQLWKLSGSDYGVFPLLLKFSRVKERTGSKPIFCGLGTCHRVWMVDLQSNRSHHLRVQITSTVPMGLVVTQIVNQCRCRTGLFTDKTPSHFLTVRQNVGEFGSSDFFEQEAIIGCAQCGLDLIINMTIFTLSPPGSP